MPPIGQRDGDREHRCRPPGVVSASAINSANTGITSARYRGSDSSHVYGETK